MYIFLVTITLLFIALLAISGVCATLDPSSKKKDRLQGICAVLGALALSFVFCKTTTINLFDAPDVKHSTEKWHIVYKNNINADIKLKYNSVSDDSNINLKNTKIKKELDEHFDNNFDLTEPVVYISITATNKHDSMTKDVTLTQNNVIEKWPKGKTPDKSNGKITQIEYRSTPVTRKWFGLSIDKVDYEEIRITIEYAGTDDPSVKQLFGEEK